MDNNYNQQPQYQAPQQPQYQQPQYQAPQQPQYQQPYQPRPQGAGIAGLVDLLIKLAPIAILVFLCLGAAGFLYDFIVGIVNTVGYYGSAMNLVAGFANGLATAAKYCFYSLVVAFAAKLLKK